MSFQHTSNECSESQSQVEGGTGDSCNSAMNGHIKSQNQGFTASEVNAHAEFSDLDCSSQQEAEIIQQSRGSSGTDEEKPRQSRSINLECLQDTLREGVSKKLMESAPCKTPKPRNIIPMSPGKHFKLKSVS